jgi:RNA polymerase sigma-B factor
MTMPARPTLTLAAAAPTTPMPEVSRPPGAKEGRAQRLAEETHQRLVEAAKSDEARRHQLQDEVVTTHLWLAEALARRFRHRGEDDQDLLQVARAGLVEASRRFDPERGAFLSFAMPTVVGVLKRHFRDQGWKIRPPRRTQELAYEIRRGWPALVQNLGAMPTEADLAANLGTTVADVREAEYASQGYYCTLLDSDTEVEGEFGQVRAEADQLEARLLLAGVWSELNPTERHLIRLRFYEELSQAQIAAVVGTSQMQVSRYLSRLLTKLRVLIGDEGGSLAS